MNQQKVKKVRAQRRKFRVRKKVTGTPERPRLSVFRSSKHIYAQLIDDLSGATIASASSRVKTVAGALDKGYGGNVKAAQTVGQAIAAAAKAKGIDRVAFDRGSYRYHGRIKALADAARAGGLQF